MTVFRILLTVIVALWVGTSAGEDELTAITANWCAPCQQFKKDLIESGNELGETAVHVIDFDRSVEYATDKKVKTVPTFILHEIDRGGVEKEIARKVGYKSLEDLHDWLKTNKKQRQ